jgi:hypothetical protein
VSVYDPSQEFQLFWPKPVRRVEVESVCAFLREALAGYEVRGSYWKVEKTFARVCG